MKKLLFLAFLHLAYAGAGKAQNKPMQPLYQSDAFTVFPDKVVQGKNEATIVSPTHIKSNYKSPANAQFSRFVIFKFSINEKDNESPIGEDHRMHILDNMHTSPNLTFGKPFASNLFMPPQTPLPTNHKFTFRVDVSDVLKQFETKGYYQTFNGDRIAKQDFKGFYIAGNSQPLSWDFVNLDSKGMKLKPSKDNPNIYEITVQLNPYNENDRAGKEWKPTLDLSKKPKYTSEQPIVDALFNLSLEEALKNIEADSTLRTGAKWGGVWTRDISYSIFLAFAYHEPEIAKISLMKKVKRNRIIQDTGSGGAYPVSSDRVVWAIAAWEIYKVTGDKKWLETTYEIIKNTLDDDEKNLKVALTDVDSAWYYRGETSFLDWREQTYPKWMDNAQIFATSTLSINVAHHRAHIVLAEMAKALGKPHEEYLKRARCIAGGIGFLSRPFSPTYWRHYVYEESHESAKFEALGNALAIVFGVAGADDSRGIIQDAPLTPFGVPCIYPQIPNIPPYHNNAVWPFVQAYWNLAAAKVGNERSLTHGLASIYRAGALFLTNYENFVAETGDYLGTEINSDRMLWSMAGNLAMVHRVFIGMNFETNGIRFSPTIPKVYAGKRTLSNFKYRQATLDITVTGFGKNIKSFKIDGKKKKDFFLPVDLVGKHTIEIEMDNESFDKDNINLVKNEFSLATPEIKLVGNRLEWKPIEGAKKYLIIENSFHGEQTENTFYEIPVNTLKGGVFYQVLPIKEEVSFKSFPSNRVLYVPQPIVVSANKSKTIESAPILTEKMVEVPTITLEPEKKHKKEFILEEPKQNTISYAQQIQLESILPASRLAYTNYTGAGFIEISTTENKSIEIPVAVSEAGKYYVRFRYANGSGAWNTDNACALRSLYVNSAYKGAMVFPQRGTNEWSDWGFSNGYQVNLQAGENKIRLVFEEWNHNMNVEVNRAVLDYLEVIKME